MVGADLVLEPRSRAVAAGLAVAVAVAVLAVVVAMAINPGAETAGVAAANQLNELAGR